jgi:hypothetical protein
MPPKKKIDTGREGIDGNGPVCLADLGMDTIEIAVLGAVLWQLFKLRHDMMAMPRACAMVRKRKATEASAEHASHRRGPTSDSAVLSELARCYCLHTARAQAACQGVDRHNSPNHWLAPHNGESLQIGWSRDLCRNAGQRRGRADNGRLGGCERASELDPSRRFSRVWPKGCPGSTIGHCALISGPFDIPK